MRNKTRRRVFAALDEIAGTMPFPILGVDSDSGGEFINHHLLALCDKRKITFTRSRSRTPTTVALWSRRTGRLGVLWSATTVTIPRQDCCCSTRFCVAVAADQLLLPATETDLEGP
ncbi:hypothetical protein [Rhodococcus ruber]|uniref:hypothetical protein n=1 Tax=Rhodococcus ruber TaxID=1830 RepID=UPI001268C62E|nr:hypothetical protein [Rhodococcus ruber]